MTLAASSKLLQRADYTHKHNLKTGRHGWLRLTPAYSVKIVEEIINNYDRPLRIFDPFCGTATTALSAAYHGHYGMTTDINPFLVWLGQAKTAHYTLKTITATAHASTRALELVRKDHATPVTCPPIHNIERWWSPAALSFLCALKGAIEEATSPASSQRTLLLIAFCRTLIKLSNAAFNHQSMSFRDGGQFHLNLDIDMCALYAEDVNFVLAGAADNPEGTAEVILGDSRNPPTAGGTFDRVITSPPYANRMSYIRELRPYMYWLGYLINGRDAGELDWSAIGGTWGIATSRLLDWKTNPNGFSSNLLDKALHQIAHKDNKNGALLANYVAKYFDDMKSHFNALVSLLAPSAEIHYIVGNSTFYGVLLPVEKIYAQLLHEVGFTAIECREIRKRNSKKELIEFDVTATWPSSKSS